MTKKIKKIYFVHAIDTEGPLYESLNAKFDRVKENFNLDIRNKSKKTLNLLKQKKIKLGGKEEEVAKMLSGHLINYNENWSSIKSMHKRIFNKKFRNQNTDSSGNPWVFSWHCLDHVGYKTNPRKRELGYHKIFDVYQKTLNKNKISKDKIFWHFHPMSTYNEAHRCATSYVNSPEFHQILCRKIIERNNFPSCFRAGFQSERPDSNLLLEQWIPFDISNMSYENTKDLDSTNDFKLGRSGDWRRATKKWEVYNPSHDDYQIKGNCRRYIGRALNVLNRIASVNEFEITRAFKQAQKGETALVGFASHDFRDLEYEVNYLRNLIKKTSKKYKDVKYYYVNTLEGFQKTIWKTTKQKNKINFNVKFFNKKNDIPYISVNLTKGRTFGPQPFLAIQTKKGRFIHDNFDFDIKKNTWHYAFYQDTLPIKDVKSIGVASNDKFGNTCIKRIRFNKKNKLEFF
jgi:hypothetical protein